MRRILHIDADAFFAAIEQRDDPKLRRRPVAVGAESARGVVLTASYEARKFGVGSAMPSRMARERCPELVFVPPRFDAYREAGEAIREIFGRYTELVEPVSIDEAYLDVSDPKIGPPSGTLIARRIKADIVRETRLTVSAGVSYCKFLAKLASGWQKPDGLTVLTPDDAERVLARLPVERIHGVGPRTSQKMHELGIHDGSDLRKQSEEFLLEKFGKVGAHYYRLARGMDDRPVDPNSVRKSVSSEETFELDIATLTELAEELPPLAQGVARRLERAGLMGRGVVLKVKYSDHSVVTRQLLLPLPVRSAGQILEVAHHILFEKLELEQPVRLLGVGVYELQEGELLQPPLFPEWSDWALGRGVASGRRGAGR
ncbi:MAG TPA: DNA polymerase IV [Trueperaceae bacterium]